MSSASAQLLAGIDAANKAGRAPLVVFDLDGTLYNNSPRTVRIIQEFAHLHASRYPTLAERVDRALLGCDLPYKLSHTMQMVGETRKELLGELEQFWVARFFTNEYVMHDMPLAGAASFVNKVYGAGGVPVYLTGRDAPNMLIGTIAALQRDGFPVGTVDTRMILKEDFHRKDLDYKEEVIDHLKRFGAVVGAFDNEPGLCNMFKANFPEATVVWLDTSHAPGAPELAAGVHPAKDFTAAASAG